MASAEPAQIWALLDDRPGNRNQVLGVAEALGLPFETRDLGFNRLARLPNGLVGASLVGLDATSRSALRPPWPALVIAAGRRSAPIARWIKRQAPTAFLVQLMWPGRVNDLGLIAVPEHDDVPPKAELIRTIGAPHRLNRNVLDAAAEGFRPNIEHLPRPWIACLVGGASKHANVGLEAYQSLIERALALASGGSLLVTTSRRTGREAERELERVLPSTPHFLHRFGDGGANYLGLLGVADAVVVTSDSASMMTEAAASQRPAFVHDLVPPPRKLARLRARLEALGHLQRLGAPWPETLAPPLLPQAAVARAIVERWPGAADAGMGGGGTLQDVATWRRAGS